MNLRKGRVAMYLIIFETVLFCSSKAMFPQILFSTDFPFKSNQRSWQKTLWRQYNFWKPKNGQKIYLTLTSTWKCFGPWILGTSELESWKSVNIFVKLSIYSSKNIRKTTKNFLTLWCHWKSRAWHCYRRIFFCTFKYLREIEFICKNTSSIFIRGPDGLDSWKKGYKILSHCPLNR